MKALTSILIILALGLTACKTSKSALPSTPVIVTNTDSVRTEYIETVRIDTVVVEVAIPEESLSQVIKDSTSHVETSLAESDAWINVDGTLGHSIRNKPQKMQAEVSVPVKETQSNNTSNSVREIPVPYPEPVYVERSPSTWEMIRLEAFWYLVGMLGIAIVWIFRIPIISAIRKLF
ncbi:MAG: hypothetical protein HDS82_06680 [Bacteroidales bacterium]|nr:hypothetical protein [Bacteroidales bacterium]